MDETHHMMFAMLNDVPLACAWKASGFAGMKFNRQIARGWVGRGFDVKTIPGDDPKCKQMFDLVWSKSMPTSAGS